LAPRGDEEGRSASGRPDSCGGEETATREGVLDGLPVGTERRNEKMGVGSMARGKGGRGGGGSGHSATAREWRAHAAVGGVAHEQGN
jgi:hypothetical protein